MLVTYEGFVRTGHLRIKNIIYFLQVVLDKPPASTVRFCQQWNRSNTGTSTSVNETFEPCSLIWVSIL